MRQPGTKVHLRAATLNVQLRLLRKEMRDEYETHYEKAEKLNGRLAMLGVIAAIGAYLVTGDLIPGIL